MEKFFEQTLLYDFYGELLTEHQRSIYEDAVCNDMSLGEIAQERGISRQGVHELLKRCDRILQDYEAKLHLVERFTRAKAQLGEIVALTGDVVMPDGSIGGTEGAAGFSGEDGIAERMRRIRELSAQLLEEL